MSKRMYAEPVSPWALNRTALDRLRTRLTEAEQRATRETDWPARRRAEFEAKTLRRELQTAEFEAKLENQRQRHAQHRAGSAPFAADSEPRWPESQGERLELVQAAMAELKRAGAVK